MTSDTSLQMHLYTVAVEDAVRPFLGGMISSFTKVRLLNAVKQVQAEFLDRNTNFVAMEPVEIGVDGSKIDIRASVGTLEEFHEQARKQLELKRLLEQLEREHIARELDYKKRRASMIRRCRKLERKYVSFIPRATRILWDTFTIPQQYAILKDIDYSARHS